MEIGEPVTQLHSFWAITSVADLSSVLSLGLTVVNAILILSIRRRLLFNATIADLASRHRQEQQEQERGDKGENDPVDACAPPRKSSAHVSPLHLVSVGRLYKALAT
jgi:hypothetical protein